MLKAHAKTAIDTAIAFGLMEVGLSYPANLAILLPGDLRRIVEAALSLLHTLSFEQPTYQAILDHLRECQSAAANSELAFIYRVTSDRLHLALNQNPDFWSVLV